MPRLPLALIPVFLLAAAVAGGTLWHLGDLQSGQGTQTISETPVSIGGPFQLTDQNGMPKSDADFRGKYMLLFFGYTYCPDVCPTTLAVMSAALDRMGQRADRIVPVFVTVDPKRDTPQAIKTYLSAFGPRWVGLTGTPEQIAEVAKEYRVYYRVNGADGENYTVDHSGVVYLMKPDGSYLANYSLSNSPDQMAADLTKKTIALR
jgi:protein SCO1/2